LTKVNKPNPSAMQRTKKWYDYVPHPAVMLFGILTLAAIMSYLIPAGQYERVTENGITMVKPGSFQYIEATPVSLFDMFRALPKGFKTAVDIVFIVLASGIMFGFLEHSKAVENAVGTMVRKLGLQRRYLIVVVMTFLFGSLGVFVGYENNIAMIPIAAVLSLAIGGDLMLAAGISVAAVTVGFGLSPINPYTIGTGQKIAQLPLFSGAWLRSILCFSGLALLAWYNVRYFKKIRLDPERSLATGLDTEGLGLSLAVEDYRLRAKDWLVLGVFFSGIAILLYGVFVHHWFISDLAALFCMLALVIGFIDRLKGSEFGSIALKSVGVVAPGAFMVGYASAIKEVLEMGHINDTIANYLSGLLTELPLYASAVGMTMVQSAMNFLIPSGSGQALATLPVLVPVGDVLGLTRQTTILAFQIGDGLTNLINPALGGLIAMLGMCRVPFDRWLRFILPLTAGLVLMAVLGVVFGVWVGYQ